MICSNSGALKILKTPLLLFTSLFMLSSCGGNDPSGTDDYYDDYYLYVSPSTINAPAEGGEYYIHVEAYVPEYYDIESDSDFIVAGATGWSASHDFQVYIYANDTGSARIGTVTVSAYGLQNVTVTVLQQGNNGWGGNDDKHGGNPGGDTGGNTGGNNGGGETTQIPSAPTGLSAYWDGPASYPYVVLTWYSVSNATKYQVFRATSANGSYSKIGDIDYNSFSDNNVSIYNHANETHLLSKRNVLT